MIEVTEQKVLRWASERNILQDSNSLKQVVKTIEEVNELEHALREGDHKETVDAIGDIMVTLAVIAHMEDVDLGWCFHCAYQQIKTRKGKLIDGIFVKEE